jgi:hypothetical protein
MPPIRAGARRANCQATSRLELATRLTQSRMNSWSAVGRAAIFSAVGPTLRKEKSASSQPSSSSVISAAERSAAATATSG